MPDGLAPTAIGLPAALVAVFIGVTLPEPLLATYAVRPSGVIAIANGLLPTGIGLPAAFVAVFIGVTLPEP